MAILLAGPVIAKDVPIHLADSCQNGHHVCAHVRERAPCSHLGEVVWRDASTLATYRDQTTSLTCQSGRINMLFLLPFLRIYFTSSDPPCHWFVIVSDMSSGNIYGIIFWNSILAFYLAFYLTFYPGILSSIYSDILSGILCGIYTDILSGILPGILSDILFGHFIWHLFWHSFLAFYLVYLRRFFVVEVRQGPLWSSACSWGPAGITLLMSLLFGSGGEHCDLPLAVEVRQGTLCSWACCWGPAGNTGICHLQLRSLQLRSGREHSAPELAVRVRRGTLLICCLLFEVLRRGTLWSTCSWGPAGNTLILSLLFGSGGKHCGLALAVEVRRGSLCSWACCSGPAIKSINLHRWGKTQWQHTCGGSFKNRKPIGEAGRCESRMAERIHWLTER